MSSLIVEVCRLEEVRPHPNADALELAVIKGWQTVVPKGRYRAGDLVTYIPIDAVIPPEHSDRWGVTKYLSNGRVRCARLRGEPSFGFVVEVEDSGWTEGSDVREHYGIEKYEPPIKTMAGDAEPAHPLFVSYTEVENLRNFPGALAPGEEVFVSEKVHGSSCRVAMIEGVPMAGSMGVRRKRPERLEESIYWEPWALPGVVALLETLGREHRQVILYGEVFGAGIQSLHYGHPKSHGFRAFDLLLDGRYMDPEAFFAACERFEVPAVPLLYRGEYSLEAIREAAAGPTTLDDTHIKEGVVVKPAVERTDPAIGRVCLKYLSDDYLLSKGISDSRDV